MNTQDSGSKKWRVVIPVIIVALAVGWYWFRLERLEDVRDNASVEHAAFVDLGLIEGNIGDQNYTLGSDLDLAKYRTVSVWCKRFSKNFGAASLMPAAQSIR